MVEQVTAAVKEEQKKRVPLAKRVAQAEEQLKIDQKKVHHLSGYDLSLVFLLFLSLTSSTF